MTTGRQKKIILIVEDERDLLETLVDKFNHEGFESLGAGDGEEGLKVALKRQPDLILLDLLMPKMDGLTMLSKLRQDQWGKNAHVIILSNVGDNERVAGALESGAYEYLVKTDWKIDEIVAKVKKRLGL